MSAGVMFRADFRAVSAETFSEHTGRVESLPSTNCTILTRRNPSQGQSSNCDCICRAGPVRFEWTTPR